MNTKFENFHVELFNYIQSILHNQIRFAMKFLSEEKMLPTKYEMLENLRIESKIQWNEGYPKEKTHWLRNQHEYEMELCKLAEIHFE